MATIKEIAEKAGVSIGTVDRVLHNRGRVSEETRKKILKITAELNYKPNELGMALRAKHKRLKIGYMIPDDENSPSDFFYETKQGALEEIDELDKYAITVKFYKISFDFSTGEDIYPVLSEEEWRELNGLITLGGNSAALHKILEKADEYNIPVVLYNMASDYKMSLATVQCNYVQAGHLAAGLCALVLSETGNIGILTSDSDQVPSFTKRISGFQQELKDNYPKLKITFVKTFPGDITSDKAVAFVQELKNKFSDTSIIYVVNPGDCRIFEAISTVMKNNVRIITNDLSSRQRDFLKKGIISATITQDPKYQGKLPLRILKDYLIYNRIPECQVIYTNLQICLRQNIQI